MRIELAPEIKITIAAPWYTESEMVSHGKSLTKDGVVENSREMREVLIGKLPVMRVGVCAKDIVNGACSGERYVIEPFCYKILFLLQFFYPGIVEWAARRLYMGKSGTT
ncbi:PREDICTED: 11-beta-hydroxysteroid dehydrogenase 1B-like [Nelumbo nucifera]|nr:PREDICTED: 11-beta-hydroxysteroid dehydrogenase 1B-like [Nelumbo nucifera]